MGTQKHKTINYFNRLVTESYKTESTDTLHCNNAHYIQNTHKYTKCVYEKQTLPKTKLK